MGFVSAAPNFERPGVVSGFTLTSLPGTLSVIISAGVVFFGSSMWLAPATYRIAGASALQWLFVTPAHNYYFWGTVGGQSSEDVCLGWVVTDATQVIASSTQQVWVEEEGETSRAYVAPGAGPGPGSGPEPTIPGDVTDVVVTFDRYTDPDAQGNRKARLKVTSTAPSPLGTFKGRHVYLEHPDQSSEYGFGLAGETALDGTYNLGGDWRPEDLGKIPNSDEPIYVEWPAPAVSERWRVYVASYSEEMDKQLVRATGADPTPSGTATVEPYAAAIVGEEYCPCAASFALSAGFPDYAFQAGGDQVWRYGVEWTSKTDDPRYPLLGGYDVVIEHVDGFRALNASPSKNETSHTSDFWAVPSSAEMYKVWLVSWSINGERNTIVEGVTPAVTFVVGRQTGTAGQEFAELVTELAASAAYGRNGEGQRVLMLDVGWTRPVNDPRYGGGIIRVILDGTDFAITGLETGEAVHCEFSQFPVVDQAMVLYVLSSDTNNNVNTYVEGVTPHVDLTWPAPPAGPPGIEYAPLVSGVSAAITYGVSKDGVEVWGFSGGWTNPDPEDYPEFAGVKVVARNQATSADTALGYWGPLDVAFRTDQWPLNESVTWTIYFVSYDVNGKENTIVPGTTPRVQNLTPTAQTTGAIVGARVKDIPTASFAAGIKPVGIVSTLPTLPHADYPAGACVVLTTDSPPKLYRSTGTAWTKAVDGVDLVADSVTAAAIAAGAISTTELYAGEILLGLGGGKPTRFKAVDAGGNPFAYMGDLDGSNAGIWAKHIHVGPDIDNPVIHGDASGVTIAGAPFTLALNGVTSKITNELYNGQYYTVLSHNTSGNANLVGIRPSILDMYYGASNAKVIILDAGNRALSLYDSAGSALLCLMTAVYGYGLLNLQDSTGLTKAALIAGATPQLQLGGVKVVGTQGAAVNDPTGGSVVDVECRAIVSTLLARLRAATGHGLIA